MARGGRMLKVGDTVEDFALADGRGGAVSWASLRGRPVVVFAYPAASTPGCTQEACDFRDLGALFDAEGITVLGLSPDAPKKQSKFASAQSLSMPLLCDPERQVLGPWGIWGEKKLYGKAYEGVIRTTLAFDAEGRVTHVWSPVKVAGHAQAVLDALRGSARGGVA